MSQARRSETTIDDHSADQWRKEEEDLQAEYKNLCILFEEIEKDRTALRQKVTKRGKENEAVAALIEKLLPLIRDYERRTTAYNEKVVAAYYMATERQNAL